MANTWIGKPQKDIDNRLSEINSLIQRSDSGEAPLSDDSRKSLNDEILQIAEANRVSQECTNRNADVGWMRENIEECKTYLNTESYAYWKEAVQTEFNGPNPCGTTTIATISKSLQKVFDFLKGIKKYYNEFVQPALNTIVGLKETIQNATELIAGVMRILIQRVRNFIVAKIKEVLSAALAELLPNIGKQIQNIVTQQIIDLIFCKFGEMISGLANLISGFLTELIGNMINAPFCAARQFTNSLLNNIANRLDKALKPIFDQINSIVGGIGKIADSVFGAINFILGFESFLCTSGPECPENKAFRASIWGGPQKKAADRFDNFLNGLNLSAGESSDLLNSFDRWVGEFPIFQGQGQEIDPFVDNLIDQLDTNCDSGLYRCGPPQVQIFGGGGAGAAGKAIVNKLGQLVGVDITNKGSGYTESPFITFIDNCGKGENASGYLELETPDDDDGDIDPITLKKRKKGGDDDDDDGDDDADDERRRRLPFEDDGVKGKCILKGSVYHEFDNKTDETIQPGVVSVGTGDIKEVKFKGEKAKSGLKITPDNLREDAKHYRIRFKEPYDNNKYKIEFLKVSKLPAAIQRTLLGEIDDDQVTERIKFKIIKKSDAKIDFFLTAPGLPGETIRVSGKQRDDQQFVTLFKNVLYTVTSTAETKILKYKSADKIRNVFPITIAKPGTKGRGKDSSIGSVSNKEIVFLDEDGDDPNATLKIGTTDPTISSAEFAGSEDEGNLRLVVRGYGNVKLTLDYDDDPENAGKAVGLLEIDGNKFRQTGETGSVSSVVKIARPDSIAKDTGRTREGEADIAVLSTSKIVFEDTQGLQSDRDFNDLVVTTKDGIFTDSAGEVKFQVTKNTKEKTGDRYVVGIANKKKNGFDVWFGNQRDKTRAKGSDEYSTTFTREFSFKTYGDREGCNDDGVGIDTYIPVNVGTGYTNEPPGDREQDECEVDSDCSDCEVCVDGDCVPKSCTDNKDCGPGCICVDGECKPEPPGKPCSDDEDCPDGQICVDGECKDVSCSSDKDCPPGTKCIDGTCVPQGCKGDEDCPEGYICVDGRCVPKGCKDDKDCPPGMICKDGECTSDECKDDKDCPSGTVCVNGKCIVVPCKSDKDCPIGTKCINGTCIPTGCTDDKDCPEGYICIDGVCEEGPCKGDKDCPPGFVCIDGECKDVPCKNDVDCPSGTVCVNGNCIVVPCSSDKDCPSGTKCIDGRCVPIGCNDDEDCPEGYICVDGKCVPKGCSLDADCPPGFVCIDGICQRPPGGSVLEEEDYVGCLTKIDVISTGIGYSPEDSITIEPNIPGLDVKVQMTEMGQIVAMTVVNGYCGLTGIPTIIINSKNGSGAEFRARVEFTRGSEFKGDLQGEVIKVIDCVYK